MAQNGKGLKAKSLLLRKVSQLVAIADFFDAMRTERPYRKTVDLQSIVLLLKETAGKDFNPLLINNFLKALNGIGAFGEISFE
jgi:HD-GYP domain-containing protein (c-di-GMP phosphodiesterase class II)